PAPAPSGFSALPLHGALPISSFLDQFGVGAVGVLHLVVRAALHDLAALHDDDLVAVADRRQPVGDDHAGAAAAADRVVDQHLGGDRKSTRLNSSHVKISYAVF